MQLTIKELYKMYKKRTLELQKLARIIELIEIAQSYILRNSKHVKRTENTIDFFDLSNHYKKRIKINKAVINRLKKYYNNTLNNLETFKTI